MTTINPWDSLQAASPSISKYRSDGEIKQFLETTSQKKCYDLIWNEHYYLSSDARFYDDLDALKKGTLRQSAIIQNMARLNWENQIYVLKFSNA